MSIVKKLLGEAPVDHQDVGNPGDGGLRVFACVKSEDLEISDELDAFLGEASNDGVMISTTELERMMSELSNDPTFGPEITQIISTMNGAKATHIILV